MEQKAFDLIIEKVGAVLTEQGFERQEGLVKEENGDTVLFLSENVAYSVLYNKDKKRFELRTAAMTEDGPDAWKSLSTWLFDPETDDMSSAESIANDYVETIQGPKRIAAIQQTKKKRKRDEDDNSDPTFFFNRMAGIFPELKDELVLERQTYGQIRNATFAKSYLLPKVEALAYQYPGTDTFKKMCDLLNDLYATGDMDVRSIITIVVLNGVENENAMENMKECFNDDLKKACKAAGKMKGKVVKPEKPKKKKDRKFMADTLNEMRR